MLDAIGIKKLESLTDINKKVAEEEKRLKTLQEEQEMTKELTEVS